MNYVKSLWTTVPSTPSNDSENQVSPSTIQATTRAPNYNSVTFTTTTTTSGNSKIIITTVPQNSQQLVYHNSKNLHQVEMATSPVDSFHSATSTLEYQNNGKVNLGFNGSSTEINNNNVTRHPNNQVVQREQYWSWSWPWLNWNQREKIFLIVIVILSLCVLTLTSLLSVVLQQNLKFKEKLLESGLSII